MFIIMFENLAGIYQDERIVLKWILEKLKI
jgi:hypothetical protein